MNCERFDTLAVLRDGFSLCVLSYLVGVVPDSWKSALIHPIEKKGDGSDPSNYRPIAITSLLSKLMESIINSQLLVSLEQ